MWANNTCSLQGRGQMNLVQDVRARSGRKGCTTTTTTTLLLDDYLPTWQEPGYLDDDDDEVNEVNDVCAGNAAANGFVGQGPPQWSFFAQTNWMTGRRVQEFDDDPTIAARLAKAKQRVAEREAERREEQKSTLGRLFTGIWGK